MITGHTRLIAHLGYPTGSFKAPMIYNPWFDSAGIDAVVVPMGVRAEDYPAFFRSLFRLTNIHGALVTMPHKITTVALLDAASTSVQIAGACNAVRLRSDGTIAGDMFDGEGFVRGAMRKGQDFRGRRALVVGAGGVGSAIAAALAKAGLAKIGLYDLHGPQADALANRLVAHYPDLVCRTGSNDPSGFDIIVNATPLGMNEGDPMPVDMGRVDPACFVGEVVMKQEMTPFLRAAAQRGCGIQKGIDMLYEMIPAYLEFFGFPTTTADNLRRLSQAGE